MERGLIRFYIYTHPRSSAEVIFRMWQRNKILREYERPEKELIEQWVLEVKQELIEKGVRLKLN